MLASAGGIIGCHASSGRLQQLQQGHCSELMSRCSRGSLQLAMTCYTTYLWRRPLAGAAAVRGPPGLGNRRTQIRRQLRKAARLRNAEQSTAEQLHLLPQWPHVHRWQRDTKGAGAGIEGKDHSDDFGQALQDAFLHNRGAYRDRQHIFFGGTDILIDQDTTDNFYSGPVNQLLLANFAEACEATPARIEVDGKNASALDDACGRFTAAAQDGVNAVDVVFNVLACARWKRNSLKRVCALSGLPRAVASKAMETGICLGILVRQKRKISFVNRDVIPLAMGDCAGR